MTVYQRKAMAIAKITGAGNSVLKLKKQDGYLITVNGKYIIVKTLMELEAYVAGLAK